MTMQRFLEFARAHVGNYVRSRHGLGRQCVDIVEMWAANCDKQPISGNAIDLFSNANRTEWMAIPNDAANFPPLGAIVTWGYWVPSGIGPLGHTAIAVAADGMSLLVLSQNWPEHSPVAFTLMRYGGCIGWLIPKLSTATPPLFHSPSPLGSD